MIQLTPTEFWAVPVPEGSSNYQLISIIKEIQALQWDEQYNGTQGLHFRQPTGSTVLPPGSWELVCLSGEISEGQAAGIVESISPYITGRVYKDYETGYFEFDAATPSFESLLRSHKLTNVAILKKIV